MAPTILNSEPAIAAIRLVVETFLTARRVGAMHPVAMGLGPRLKRTLERLLDTVVDHRAQSTLREEAQELASSFGPTQSVSRWSISGPARPR